MAKESKNNHRNEEQNTKQEGKYAYMGGRNLMNHMYNYNSIANSPLDFRKRKWLRIPKKTKKRGEVKRTSQDSTLRGVLPDGSAAYDHPLGICKTD